MDDTQTEHEETVTSSPVHEEESPAGSTDLQAEPAGTVANLVSGVAVALLGVGSLAVALELGFGNLTQPRAGTWPAILSALLIVFGSTLAVRAKTYTDAEKISRHAAAVGVGAISIVAAVQLMPLIGFEIPAVLLMIFWMKVLGREKLLKSIIIAVVTVIALYLVFVTGLRISIPHLF
ncbi:tripartite tricarboxylate transporter TctB family protein [Brevibacterium yomogidense]|uniref:tripartite tricarboxylate transporter TctB family protein n=1 Tax=Brevibacterium yomogidense TaxID=946573 RepID=UPI0018DEFF4B